MVGIVCRLKLSLIAAGLRGNPAGTVGFVISLFVGFVVAASGFFVTMRMGLAFEFGAHLMVITFALVALGWGIVPILAFRSDETLDPARFALLPVPPGPMAGALLAASAIGVPPIAFTIALTGALAGFAATPAAVLVGALAIVITMLMSLLLGRILPLALAPVLRGRRGTDVMIGGLVGATALVLLLEWAIITSAASDVDAITAALAGAAGWTPPGFAALALLDARDGDFGIAALRLAVAAAAVAAVWWLWARMLGRALADLRVSEAGDMKVRGRLGAPGLFGLAPRTAAVVGRELRYQRREPRRKAGIATMMLLFGVVLTMLAPISSGELGVGTSILVTNGALTALTLVGNQFGLQGSALWSVLASTASPRELRSELLGASLVAALIGTPLLLLFAALNTVGVAGGAAEPEVWAASIGSTLGAFYLALGVSPLISVYFPYALPDRGHNPFAGPGPGRGMVVTLTMLAAMITVNALAIPFYLLAADLDAWTAAPYALGAVVYGLAVAWTGISLAARAGVPRLPEILATVSRPVT
ncbi:ABC-2 type transport system permease protein [Murinocardiopsis flavida]|uniref:ABC-2 type transport system permease protein n=1 Tax=Murinocardiopsis flavida TaxID=645275 RepID=A0A2P8DII2_9ACTN|nr:hypothetical protein [Murinocardiopsis flavida]PSK97032.1 ABC-2 type transport system permease protein [Murinocardiopsis flavida]